MAGRYRDSRVVYIPVDEPDACPHERTITAGTPRRFALALAPRADRKSGCMVHSWLCGLFLRVHLSQHGILAVGQIGRQRVVFELTRSAERHPRPGINSCGRVLDTLVILSAGE